MLQPTDLMGAKEFIVQTIEQAGGAVDEREPGLLDAMLPAELTSEDAPGSLQTFALEMDALDSEPSAELSTVGSTALQTLIS